MGNTALYNLPYPELTDPPDGAGQMKAIAQAVETLINAGYTMRGDIVMGEAGVANARVLYQRKLDGADAYEDRLYVMSGGGIALALFKNTVEVNRLRINPDSSIGVGPSGGTVRPVPFATSTGTVDCVLSNAISASATLTYPTNRFSQWPAVVATPYSSPAQNFSIATFAHSASSVQITARNVDNAATSATVKVFVIAIQMTPTGGFPGGPFAAADESIIRRNAVCHTEGCDNADETIEIHSTEENRVVCGACSHDISDVSAVR